MGIKNIYKRFIWFDDQVKSKKLPNASSLSKRFEVSIKTIKAEAKNITKIYQAVLRMWNYY